MTAKPVSRPDYRLRDHLCQVGNISESAWTGKDALRSVIHRGRSDGTAQKGVPWRARI